MSQMEQDGFTGARELAVLDPLPVFELGLLTSLERGGTRLGNAEALGRWLAKTPRGILVLTVQDEHAWDLLCACRWP